MKRPISCVLVVTISALMVLSSFETTWAGPLPVGTAGLKMGAASEVVDVRYRRHRHRHHRRNEAIAAGMMFGLLSVAIASRYHDDYDDYGDYYYPSYGYYGGHYRSHHVGHHRHHVSYKGAQHKVHHHRH